MGARRAADRVNRRAVNRDEALGVAVVGAGGMGACHARHVAALNGAEVRAVADPDEAAGSALAAEVGAAWYADGLDAIDSVDGIDAVVIASPDRFHHGSVMAALERSLPVLCEKPLTDELHDAKALVEAEVALGSRLIQLGFMRQYDPAHAQVAEALASLGEVNHLRCVHRNSNYPARAVDRILVESLVHDVHSVRFLSGSEIAAVHALAVERNGGVRFVLLNCLLENGGVASIEFDESASGYEVWVEVDAEHGNVVSTPPSRALVRSEGSVGSSIGDDWFAPFLGTYRIEMEAWLDAARRGGVVGPSAWDGYVTQVVVATSLASLSTGVPTPVDLPPRPALYEHPSIREPSPDLARPDHEFDDKEQN